MSLEIKSHIELGHDLKLFFFDQVSPGSCFFLPHGAIVYGKLITRLRKYYRNNGYDEVVSPNIYDKKLWMTSGHWEKYRDNMFLIQKTTHDNPVTGDVDANNAINDTVNDGAMEFSLKPMNCPGHAVIFKRMKPHYKQLPVRLAEFGVLHRNELSGSLRGLTRVRRFQQDDAHHFCTLEQIEGEIENLLEFIDKLYKDLGCKYQIEVSTRPEKFLGEVEIWDKAEEILKSVVENITKKAVTVNEGDGAFYGPKIDISIQDGLERWHQCGTIQLDFNLPERFKLEYIAEDSSLQQPIMIHRALFGSLERFIAIVLEHTQGKLPFWMSPRQIAVLPIKPEHYEYADQIQKQLYSADYQTEAVFSSDDLRQKIKDAERMKFNYIVVIGDREVAANEVAVRNCQLTGRAGRKIINMTLEEFLELLDKN